MPFQSRRFADGFFFDHNDFNNQALFMQSQIFDTWSTVARFDDANVVNGNNRCQPHLDFLYCTNHGGAPKASATTRTIVLHGGLVAQQVSQGAVGASPRFMAQFLEDAEVSHQLTVGDATNPRFDILCVRLSYDDFDSTSRDQEDASTRVNTSQVTLITHRVKVESQIVIGTPAGSPSQPATPAGWVQVAAVFVPAAWNAVIDPANILDYRIPVGIRMFETTATEIINSGAFIGGATWGLTGGTPFGFATATALSGGEAKFCSMIRNIPPNSCRLLQISVTSRNADRAFWELSLRKIDESNHGTPGAALVTGMETLLIPNAGVNNHTLRKYFATSTPYWANGETSGLGNAETETDVTAGYKRLGILFRQTDLSAGFIGPIRYVFAGGL